MPQFTLLTRTINGGYMSGFGFTPNNGVGDGDDNSDAEKSQNPANNGPFGFGNFGDIFQQFSGMGLNLQALLASLSGQATPSTLSQQMIRDISRKYLTAHGELPVGVADLVATQEAFNIADLWINEATTFPTLVIPDTCALSRRDWIDSTLAGWEELAKPLVDGMSQAMTEMLKETLGNESLGNETGSESLRGFNIPGFGNMNISQSSIAAIMGTFMSSLISTQLGQTIGNLSTSVTGANDVALPLTSPIRPQLIPQNVTQWGKDLEIPEAEIRIYLALREIAAARLFAATPWLREYVRNSIATYGKGIRVDITAITQQAEDAMNSGQLDPSNPESMTLALSGGMFTPEETPTQKAALERLETVLALIEGWIDAVVTQAAGDRLPSIIRLRETQQRRRATNSPTQQLFATLVGLEVSPRRTREAIAFWEKIAVLKDIQVRDQIWDESFLLPTSDDLTNPESFLKAREIPDDLSGLQ
jgi:putative hydrolase